MTPLNGTKTHPLSDHAKGVLRALCSGPIPMSEINAGVVNRLQREDLIETVMRPSPFVSHKGRPLAHAQVTEAGRRAVAQ